MYVLPISRLDFANRADTSSEIPAPAPASDWLCQPKSKGEIGANKSNPKALLRLKPVALHPSKSPVSPSKGYINSEKTPIFQYSCDP